MSKNVTFTFIFMCGMIISACGVRNYQDSPNKSLIQNIWARPGSKGDNSAVYFDIVSETQDILVRASSDVADGVELHLSKMVDGVMKMEPQSKGVALPAGEVVKFEPGGFHVMLINLQDELIPDNTFPLTLEFLNSEPVTIDVPVKQP